MNLHPLRDQILSLARLPFRHSRNLDDHDLRHSFERMARALQRLGPVVRGQKHEPIRPAPIAMRRQSYHTISANRKPGFVLSPRTCRQKNPVRSTAGGKPLTAIPLDRASIGA